MPCATYEELHQAVLEAMGAQSSTYRDLLRNNDRRVTKKVLEQRYRTANSQVESANTSLKDHVGRCNICRAEGSEAVDEQSLTL
jgi:hypothetical protein